MAKSSLIKNLQLITRNREWLQAPNVSVPKKLMYYPSLVASYCKLIFLHRKTIHYLGQTFLFDNPAAPLNLQGYPYEIGIKILNNMNKPPQYVLDIGGNIGQFSCTVAAMVPGVLIDVFEPNPEIIHILKSNLFSNKKVTVYNLGLSKETETKMFFQQNKSATGSLIAANAGTRDQLKKIAIKNTTDPSIQTKRNHYDLVKVDVEGYEYQALDCLTSIATKYLFIEISGIGRTKDYLHSKIFKKIEDTFGAFDIYYASHYSKEKPTFDLLVKFVD